AGHEGYPDRHACGIEAGEEAVRAHGTLTAADETLLRGKVSTVGPVDLFEVVDVVLPVRDERRPHPEPRQSRPVVENPANKTVRLTRRAGVIVRIPRPLARPDPRAHRLRPTRLPPLVHRPRPQPAHPAADGHRAVCPLAARGTPIPALDGLPATVGRGRLLPS